MTLVFRVANDSPRDLELSGRAALPEGWKLVTDEAPFRLAAGSETVRLVPVFVPVDARAGAYSVGYLISALNDPPVLAEGKAEVRVLLEARIGLQAMDLPPFNIAGEVTRSRFQVSNQGNAPLDVDLTVKSNGYEVGLGAIAASGSRPAETLPAEVIVRSDPGLRKEADPAGRASRRRRQPLVRAASTGERHDPAGDHPACLRPVNDAYNKLPMEGRFIALAGGKGPDGRPDSWFPDREPWMPWGSARLRRPFPRSRPFPTSTFSGMQREEYRLRYDSPLRRPDPRRQGLFPDEPDQPGRVWPRGRGALELRRPGRSADFRPKTFFIASSESDRALQLGFRSVGGFFR